MQIALRRVAKGTAVAIAVLLLQLPINRLTLYEDLNRLAFDFAVVHAGLTPSSSQVVLVDFDEDTFQILNEFPISRQKFADAIRRVSAGKPRVIGLDVFLSETRTPEDDQVMQDALTAAGNVVLASQAQVGTLAAVQPLKQFCTPEQPEAATGFCVEGKPGALAYALVNMPVADDGRLCVFLVRT